ncbi:MAG: MBL fold metallo-hydrolase [Muribaculaceae bacterium]|nr:MBL fold metallo-hydrolase [Muribaculaceae bacterium]
MSNHSEHLEVEFLGTGTSTGVPQIKCTCPVCRSADPRDTRLRTSAIVRYRQQSILIDCGPDFRTQILRASNDHLDGLLLTHIHYDHVGGLDDLRAYCNHQDFPIYARQDVIDDLRMRLPYCFAEHPYPGVPLLHITPVREGQTFFLHGIPIEALPVRHYKLNILGYRIGPLAYITDANGLDAAVIDRLHGTPLLIINALRHEPHLSHFSLSETLQVIDHIQPRQAYLIHMSHGIGFHAETQAALPHNVHLAHDGMVINY